MLAGNCYLLQETYNKLKIVYGMLVKIFVQFPVQSFGNAADAGSLYVGHGVMPVG